MIPEYEKENFVEACSRCVQARYGETKAKKSSLHQMRSIAGKVMVIGNEEQRQKDTSKKEIGVGCCYVEVA